MNEPVASAPSPRRRIRRKYALFAIGAVIVLAAASISIVLTVLQRSHPPLKADVTVDFGSRQKLYPPYYTYLLLGSKNYLGLADGGYVANSATTTHNELVVTGFYTHTKDDVLVVNTTGQRYSQLNILITLAGSGDQDAVNGVPTSASYYVLNSANPHIGTQKVDVSSEDNGYTVTVNVPAYSTVALSIDVS